MKIGSSISDKPWRADIYSVENNQCFLSYRSSLPFIASIARSRERRVFLRHHYNSLPLGAKSRLSFSRVLKKHLIQWRNRYCICDESPSICIGSVLINPYSFYFILFFKGFMYVFMRDTHRERQRHRQREKQAPWREPNVGLNLRTPGSCPEPKADAQPLSHPGIPLFALFKSKAVFSSRVCFILKCCLCWRNIHSQDPHEMNP